MLIDKQGLARKKSQDTAPYYIDEGTFLKGLAGSEKEITWGFDFI